MSNPYPRLAQPSFSSIPVTAPCTLTSPTQVPYDHLTDTEKEYDRITAMNTLRLLLGEAHQELEGCRHGTVWCPVMAQDQYEGVQCEHARLGGSMR